MRINKHDTNGIKPLLGKGELGYDDYAAGGDVGRVYVGTGSENIALAEKLEANMMTKAQFNALAEERKANRGGSGFDNFGSNYTGVNSIYNVNQGLNVLNVTDNMPNSLLFSVEDVTPSKTSDGYPFTLINGVRQKLKSIGANYNRILLPTAPTIYPHDTVLTTEQIASGVIKHADASNSGLIVNGKFDVDTSGWTTNNAIISRNLNGQLVVDDSTNIGDSSSARQFLDLITGKEYIMQVTVSDIIGTGFYITLAPTLTATSSEQSIINNTSSTGVFTIKFTAQGNKYLSLGATGTSTVTFDNIAVYPADAISRSDLVFLESWHEDVSEKNFVYPLGNVQYLGGNTDGLTGIANGAFTGFETYSLFGNWQTPSSLIGKGYIWSNLTEVQKRAFISNPENNCYLDGDKVIQVRYRVRVVQGWGDDWGNVNTESGGSLYYGSTTYLGAKGKDVSIASDLQLTSASNFYNSGFTNIRERGIFVAYSSVRGYEGKCFALPIALISRRNQGMYHPVYNANGSKKASDDKFWYDTSVSFISISDCFDTAKLLTASGYIGSVSGRPDGLFYDQVHESDITDLRNSSKKVEDYNRLICKEFNKLVAGTTRGKEGEWITRVTFGTTNLLYDNGGINVTIYDSNFLGASELSIGDSINVAYYNGSTFIYDRATVTTPSNQALMVNAPNIATSISGGVLRDGIKFCIYSKRTTRTKSNTLLHCNIIGNPANYPTSWKESGVCGTPLIVAEDGTSLLPDGVRDTFKLSRKANATPILCLRSTDSGVTWTSFTPTFNTTTNEITLTDEPAGNLVMVYYQTHTSIAVPVVNSEVLEIGDVSILSSQNTQSGSYFVSSLIGKTPTNTTSPTTNTNIRLRHHNLFQLKLDSGVPPENQQYSIGQSQTPAVKVFPYLTRTNGKAYLNLVFKEMKHNGTSWGDDNKFSIVDNVSTTTDNNAQTVLIGQKTVELPYFIAGDE